MGIDTINTNNETKDFTLLHRERFKFTQTDFLFNVMEYFFVETKFLETFMPNRYLSCNKFCFNHFNAFWNAGLVTGSETNQNYLNFLKSYEYDKK